MGGILYTAEWIFWVQELRYEASLKSILILAIILVAVGGVFGEINPSGGCADCWWGETHRKQLRSPTGEVVACHQNTTCLFVRIPRDHWDFTEQGFIWAIQNEDADRLGGTITHPWWVECPPGMVEYECAFHQR